MSSTKIEVKEYTVRAGTDAALLPLEIAGLPATAKGWVWPSWFEPRAFTSLPGLEDFSIHLMCASGDEYTCVLPVSSTNALAHIRRNPHADPENPPSLFLNVRSVSATEDGKVAVIVVRTPDATRVSTLPGVAISHARQWISAGRIVYLGHQKGVFDGLGFCTWSSLGEGNAPTEKTLRRLVDKLVDAQMPIQTFIIDDGWQNRRTFFDRSGPEPVRRRGLWDFSAHPDMGPAGLRAAVQMIKSRLSVLPVGNVEVGVWVALTGGYWEGVHPDSPLVSKYNCRVYEATLDWWHGVPNAPGDAPFLPGGVARYILPPPETALAFWKRYFLALADAGVTFIKVDNQAAVLALRGVEGAVEARELWRAMYAAALDVFGANRVIHCMAHDENTWTGEQGLGIVSEGERFVWRNSDDFGLQGPRGHQDHFFNNIFNALVANALCVVPDADMFQTATQYPHAHAWLRAMFPGPLVLSDRPGEHDTALVWRLIAMDKGGVVRVLKPCLAPEPLARRMLDHTVCDYSNGTGLWAASRSPHATLLGVWNTRGDASAPRRVFDRITVDDVEDALGHALHHHYAVVRVNLDTPGLMAANMLRPEQHGELGRIELAPLGAAAFWITPMWNIGAGPVTILGLIDAYAGPMAVASVEHTINRIDATIKYAGTLGLIVAAPLQPSATALVDGRPELVRLSRLPRLDGREQNLFLLQIRIGAPAAPPGGKAPGPSHATDDVFGNERQDGGSEGWRVHVYIE